MALASSLISLHWRLLIGRVGELTGSLSRMSIQISELMTSLCQDTESVLPKCDLL